MKRLLSIGIIILFLGLSISSSTGHNTTEQSGKPLSSGNTLYVGGSGPGNYTKIQDAIDDASDGDTVYVYSGTYYENVFVVKSINLIGEDRDATIIDVDNYEDAVYISTNWVNISNFTIKYEWYCGVDISNSNNTTISDNILHSKYDIGGISISHSNNIVIKGNTISGGGVRISYSNDIVIKGNIISGGRIGAIYSNKIFVIGNIISGLRDEGMSFWYSKNNIIKNNNISNYTWGGINVTISCNNVISGNTISNIWRGGALNLRNQNNSIITSNILIDNIFGISIWSSNNNTIIGNIISNNRDEGILTRLYYPSYNNLIYHNTFINNSPNAYDWHTNSWDDDYPSGGNYWDDYVGNDSDGDGIGDIPYNISGGLNQDKYPLGYFDTKPPKISIEWEAYKSGCHWYVDFRINASDGQGGMDRVEVFINDGLQEIITGTGPDYVFTIQWSKSLRSCVIYFYCYDRAGNVAILSVNGSDIESYPYFKINNMFSFKWLERFPIFNQLLIRFMERWSI